MKLTIALLLTLTHAALADDPSLWLDFSDSATVQTDGVTVTRITDKASGVRYAVRAPGISASGPFYPATLNGKSAALFNSTNQQCLQMDQGVAYPSYSAYAVIRASSFSQTEATLLGSSAGVSPPADGMLSIGREMNTQAETYDGVNWINWALTIPLSSTKVLTVTSDSTTTGTHLYVDGTEVPPAVTSGTALDVNLFWIGCRYIGEGSFFSGYLGEVRMYPSQHTPQRVNQLANTLHAKWVH